MARATKQPPPAPEPREIVQDPRQNLATARRDAAGFIEGPVPSLTDEQITWITYRLAVESDQVACESSGISWTRLSEWLTDPGFISVFQVAMQNKREGFRLLTSQLLPKAVLTLIHLYELAKGSDKDALRAADLAMKLHLRAQGLLIDTKAHDPADQVARLLEALRREEPVKVIDMAPKA